MALNQTFQQFEKQLNRRFRLIGGASELRRLFSNASSGLTLTIYLTENIFTVAGFTLPPVDSVIINGGGKFGFVVKGGSTSINPLFTIPNGTKFKLEDSSIEAEIASGITSIIGSSVNVLSDVVFQDVRLKNSSFIIKQTTDEITKSSFQNIIVEGSNLELVGPGVAIMEQCNFSNIRSDEPLININAGSETSAQFQNIDLNLGSMFSTGTNIFFNIQNIGSSGISSADYKIVQASNHYNELGRTLIKNSSLANKTTLKIIFSGSINVVNQTIQGSVATTDATPTALLTIPTEDNRAYLFEARVRGATQTLFDSDVAFIIRARFKNVTGSLFQLSNTTEYSSKNSSPTWNANFDKSGTNAVLFITGAVGTSINWTATTLSDEVG